MSLEDESHNVCKECHMKFDSSFELVDHLIGEDEEFDPYLLLPTGHKLMVGSLLRFMYDNSHNPEQIELMSQSTYITLFAAENGANFINELVEDMLVKSAFKDFDSSLKRLLNEEENDEGNGE